MPRRSPVASVSDSVPAGSPPAPSARPAAGLSSPGQSADPLPVSGSPSGNIQSDHVRFVADEDVFDLTGAENWQPVRQFVPLPPELVFQFSGPASHRTSVSPVALPLAAPAPDAIFYGLAYAPARLCTPHIRREIHAMADFFHRHWKSLTGEVPPSSPSIATVLHGWRFVFNLVSPHLFPSGSSPDVPSGVAASPRSLYTAARDALRSTPPSRKSLRHFARLLQEDMKSVTVVPDGTLAPFQPTPFTRYYLLPPPTGNWYHPVLFLTRSVEKLESPRHPAHRLALLTGPDFVRLSPAIIVSRGEPATGEKLAAHHARHLQEMMAPFLAPAPESARSRIRSQIELFPSTDTPSPPGRRKEKTGDSGFVRLRELEAATRELLQTPDRWSYELPLRNLNGQVLPPPRWIAERLMGIALQTGQTTYENTTLGLSATMDPQLGIVAINPGYMEHFSRPVSFHHHLWLPEPWMADIPYGPFHVLARAVDMSVWEGRPHLTRHLLGLYPPAELRRQLPPAVWERWNLVSGWAARTLAERPVTPSPLRYHRLRPHRRDADLIHLLHDLSPGVDPESTVYLHTYQATIIADELRRQGRPADAEAWTRRILEQGFRQQTWHHGSGILEAAIQLQDYLVRHAPDLHRDRVGSAGLKADGWSTHPAVFTPTCLHRLESFVIGTRHEASYAQMLSGFLERLAAHSRDLDTALTMALNPPSSAGTLPTAHPPTDDSPANAWHPARDGVFPALDAFIWGCMSSGMLPDFLTHRIPPTSPPLFRDGFAAYLWKLHLLGSSPDAIRNSLSYENECIHRLKTLEYHSTFNVVLMTMGTLDLLRQSHQIRQSWLSELSAAHERGNVTSLLRLAMLSPVIPLRHPDWSRMWHGFCRSSSSGSELSPAMSLEISRMMTAERSLGMVEPVVDMEHLPFRSYYPHEWLPHHRPQAYRMGGCHPQTRFTHPDLVAYRHYPLLATPSSMGHG